MIDNPGTLQSAILNQATNQVTIAYQNTRDIITQFDAELRERVKKLKESKGFGWVQQNITSNQTTELYKNMYDKKSSDVKFINPWADDVTLDDVEKEFLKYAIIKINSTRGNGIDLKKAPLVKGDFSSEVAMRGGIVNFIRDRFKYLSIWNAQTRAELKKKVDDTVTKLLSSEQSELVKKGEQWEAINTMSDLDDPKKERRIN